MTSELSNTNAIADDALQLEPAALFVESYFPEQISACAESPQRHSGSPASWTRANPWLAMASAFGAGAALAMISAPAFRMGKRAVRNLHTALSETLAAAEASED